MNMDLQNNDMEVSALSVGICIPTFRNNDGLGQLLESVRRLKFEKVGAPEVVVFVADNTAEGLARELVARIGSDFPFPLHYEVEKQQGIPFVRNRLVAMSKECDLIAFVDDDEEVISEWLDELLHTYHGSDAQIVTGPVIGRLPENAPKWAVNGKFYDSPHHQTARAMDTFFTNNTLIERNLLNAFEKPFEESMAFCGGTDSLLAKQVLMNGARCVWCQEAVVYEDVPAQRVTLKWYLRRRYRIGNTSTYHNRFLEEKFSRASEVRRAFRMIGLSIIVSLSSVIRGFHKLVRGAGYFSYALGILGAVLNRQVNEYGRADYR